MLFDCVLRPIAGLPLLALLLTLGAAPAWGFDRGADGQFDHRSSPHFDLYQDVAIDRSSGFHGSRRFEQQVLTELERAYDALDDLLGLRPTRRIEVVIYDPGVFDQQFAGAFRFAAAGFYHGVIRIRGATQLNPGLARVLHHEIVHAALDAAAPSYGFPAWLNEGLAEWFEARALGKYRLSGAEQGVLVQASRHGTLFSFEALATPSFGHLGPQAARIAYLQSYALIDYLARSRGERALRDFCDELIRTRNLARTVQRVFKKDFAELQARFFDELS